MPTVLHICKAYAPVNGGVQRVVRYIAERLVGFKQTVITTGADGSIPKQTINGVEVVRYRSFAEIASLPIAPALPFNVATAIRNYDLVALHYPFPLADVGLVLNFSRTPLVVHWHSNIIAQRYLRWLVLPLTWLVLTRAKAIVITHEAMQKNSLLLRAFKRKVQVIPYGLDPLVLPNVSLSVDSGDEDYFLLLGRQVGYKGIDVAINALKFCQARLMIVGDGPLYERHKLLVETLQFDDRVTFVRYADDNQAQAFLLRCRALVVASTTPNEAFALVQLEAMRAGKPVINTALESTVPYVARNQKEGLTVPAGNAKALGEAMQDLQQNPDKAHALGGAGKLRFDAHFSGAAFVAKLAELYQTLICRSAR